MKFLKTLLFAAFCSFCTEASVSGFRLDCDRLWLHAEDVSLSRLFEQFVAAGVDVKMDPGADRLVSGEWVNEDAETALAGMIAPNNYQLIWSRESGPLGTMTRLTGIRVFRPGHGESARSLESCRRIVTAADEKTRFVARELLVGFGPNASIEDLRALLARTGGTILSANTELGVYRILLPEGANVPDLAAQLANEGSVALAEPNYIYDLPELLTDDSAPASERDWSAPADDSPIAVAVLDSGLASDSSLDRAVLDAFDATNPDAPLTTDPVGHGTLMARLASGLLDPYNTPVGEGVSVVAVKAFADDGSADSFTLMNAVTHAVQNSSGPLSLSWGSETHSQFIESAVQYAVGQGRPVFAAVGNENTGRPMYPAAYDGVVGVAASNGGKFADYSNRGDFVDIVAPGSAGGSQGTSVATAYVSHIAALYMKHNPEATAVETIQALYEASEPDGFLTEAAVKRLLIK